MTENLERFMKLVNPDAPPVPKYVKDLMEKVAEKVSKGERVIFMMPRRPGRATTIH